MSEQEKRVGARVRYYRESAMLSQQDLATKMREAGFNWSQGTLSRVELGDRPLRLTEAQEVAKLCGQSPAGFFQGQQETSSTSAGLQLAVRTLQALIEGGDS